MLDLPKPIVTKFGNPTTLTPLGGMSQAQVWHLAFGAEAFVLKKMATPQESFFYHKVAPQLQSHGVPTPGLVWHQEIDQVHWLLLEYMPLSLPRWQWVANVDQLAILGRLHNHHLDFDHTQMDFFKPGWTNDLTERALSLFPAATQRDISPLLTDLQRRSDHLFETKCWISGDPNPLNWGLGLDYSLVLFDWERFGRGSPALDLAITVPGLGDASVFEKVARVYLAQMGKALRNESIASLARDIGLAKTWVAVEFLAQYKTDKVSQTQAIEHLTDVFPTWIKAFS